MAFGSLFQVLLIIYCISIKTCRKFVRSDQVFTIFSYLAFTFKSEPFNIRASADMAEQG
jgi:hypothetical protein